jgi:hypothetical protein
MLASVEPSPYVGPPPASKLGGLPPPPSKTPPPDPPSPPLPVQPSSPGTSPKPLVPPAPEHAQSPANVAALAIRRRCARFIIPSGPWINVALGSGQRVDARCHRRG